MEKIPWMLYRREDRIREPERRGNEFRSELDYLRGLYPVSAKKSQILAEEACDLLEYRERHPEETAGEKEEQDLLQVMLVNEIYRRRILKRAVTDRQSEETGR